MSDKQKDNGETTCPSEEGTGCPPTATSIQPCKHMENHISSLSDGSLHGPMRWYTQLHASYCQHCGPALDALKRLRTRLGSLHHAVPHEEVQLSTQRREKLENEMERIDKEVTEEVTKEITEEITKESNIR